MTYKVSAVENEIGRVKCYQSRVKELLCTPRAVMEECIAIFGG